MCDRPNRIVIEVEKYDTVVYAVRAERPDQVVVIVKPPDGPSDVFGPSGYTIEPLAVVAAGLAVEYEVGA